MQTNGNVQSQKDRQRTIEYYFVVREKLRGKQYARKS